MRVPLSSIGLVSHCPDSWQMGPTAAMIVSGVMEPTWTVSLETVGGQGGSGRGEGGRKGTGEFDVAFGVPGCFAALGDGIVFYGGHDAGGGSGGEEGDDGEGVGTHDC